jgi:hypothetical protein
MNEQELLIKIELHAKNAYEMVPFPVEYLPPYVQHEWIYATYDTQNWQQVYLMLWQLRIKNKFSQEIVLELEMAGQYLHELACLYFKNAIVQFNEYEIGIIGECLNVVVNGPFISDAEFVILSGMKREEVAPIAQNWPEYVADDSTTSAAVGMSMYMLLDYPHHREKDLQSFFTVPLAEIQKVDAKWSKEKKTYRTRITDMGHVE